MPHRHLRPLALSCLALALPALAASARAQAAPPPPRRPWRFSTAFAIQDISGNRQLRILQSTLRADRQTPERVNFAFKLEGAYGRSAGQSVERRAGASLRLDWTPRALVSPFLGFDWDYNRILRINSRVNGGAGANFNPVYSDSARVTIALGVVEEYKDIAARGTSPGSITNDTRFHSRLAITRTLRSGVQTELNVKYQPVLHDFAAYLFKADGTLRVALTSKLKWETTYRWWRDSAPAPGVRKDDRMLTTGLQIQW